MLRFLGIRLLQAIPVLLIMSMITFMIIQAPPGDYGDFIKSNIPPMFATQLDRLMQGGGSAPSGGGGILGGLFGG